MVEKFYLKYLDVEYKWVDGTKTIVELCTTIAGIGDFVLTYVHTEDDIDTCKKNEKEYMDILLNVVRENCLQNESVTKKGIN